MLLQPPAPGADDHPVPSLLTSLSLLLLAGFLAVGLRWWLTRKDALGRDKPLPVWSLCLLLSLSVAAAIPGAQRRTQEHRLASVASRLVGHEVAVHCQSNAGALLDAGVELGYVKYDESGTPEPRTTLKREPCGDLRSYVSGDKRRPSLNQVIAVHVLTHEAMHMRGQTNEAVTECQAMQRDAATARMLGASQRQAEGLARIYWRIVYPDMPEDYRTGDCKPAGQLDEGLESPPWLSAAATP